MEYRRKENIERPDMLQLMMQAKKGRVHFLVISIDVKRHLLVELNIYNVVRIKNM